MVGDRSSSSLWRHRSSIIDHRRSSISIDHRPSMFDRSHSPSIISGRRSSSIDPPSINIDNLRGGAVIYDRHIQNAIINTSRPSSYIADHHPSLIMCHHHLSYTMDGLPSSSVDGSLSMNHRSKITKRRISSSSIVDHRSYSSIADDVSSTTGDRSPNIGNRTITDSRLSLITSHQP